MEAVTSVAHPAICVFAKPPAPGTAKTRLAAALGDEAAAFLAWAFLRDTWDSVRALPWATPVLAVTETFPRARELYAAHIWLQGRGDLGARIERVLRRALRRAPMAFAVGSDTPGLPTALLECAKDALARADAVLGPSEDGGFYLIGLRSCPRGLLRDLPWSARETFARTLSRLGERGLRTSVLPIWFDVDQISDLEHLRALIERAEIVAPESARAIARALRSARWATA